MQYLISLLVFFCNHLAEEERIDSLLSLFIAVFFAVPSVVCECGFSWPYLFAYYCLLVTRGESVVWLLHFLVILACFLSSGDNRLILDTYMNVSCFIFEYFLIHVHYIVCYASTVKPV